MKIFGVVSTWSDGDHEVTEVVSLHATEETAREAMDTLVKQDPNDGVFNEHMGFSVEELELAPVTVSAEDKTELSSDSNLAPSYDEDFYGALSKVLDTRYQDGFRFDFNPRIGLFAVYTLDDHDEILTERTYSLEEQP